ncbi:Lateral signaling target protein 2 -like protein [Echinococcus granulosus]|nr:Lateral signaling target protein 2 -like protein [Echinococcus granulosus]
MGTWLMSGPTLEAIYRFHECSVRSQIEETKLLHLNSSLVYGAIETSRKRLVRSLLKLIRTCVAEPLRHQRHFRMKYTEELNLATLEESLVSTANKVLDMAPTDRSLMAIRPIARTFLATLARVQSQVATVVELTAKRDRYQHRNQPSVTTTTKGIFSRRNSSPSHLSFFVEAVTSEVDHIDVDAGRETCSVTKGRLLLPTSTSLPLLHSDPAEEPNDCDRDKMADETTSLMELLIEVDHDMAIFEFALVSSISRRLRTEAEADSVQEVAVLFSETLEWALSVGLIDARQLSERDPLLFFALPRLAVLVGCLLLPNSPIGPNRLNAGGRAPFMFAESTRDLTYLSRQLAVLRADQLWRLACWTSPFGLSDAEARCVDAATATVTGGGEGVVKSSTTQPPSLVFGWNTYGLHCIYKCIARVAGNLSANHPSEYRDILQFAVELHDPSSTTRQNETPDLEQQLDLQPICPLDGEAAIGCLRDGCIHNVRLADLFDWHSVVASKASKRPFADLFHRRIDDKANRTAVELHSSDSPLEVGIDVVTTLNSEEEREGSKKQTIDKNITPAPPPSESSAGTETTSRSLLLAFLRSTPIEDTVPADPPNPLYPLAPWQPDHFVGVGYVDDTDENDDSDVMEDTPEDAESYEVRRWRSGAARVGRECARCKARFLTLLRRRHHCRRCGHIFCAACCSEKAPVAALLSAEGCQKPPCSGGVMMVRVCVECAEFVRSGLAEALDQAVISF